MKVVLKLECGSIIKLSEVLYCDPSKEKIHQVCREILDSLEKLKRL